LNQQASSKSSPNPKAKKEKLELLASFLCKAITPHINQFPAAAGAAGVLRKNYAFLDTKAKRAKEPAVLFCLTSSRRAKVLRGNKTKKVIKAWFIHSALTRGMCSKHCTAVVLKCPGELP
jgi:hypothetical protein